MNARDELGKLLFTLPVSDRAADTAPEIMRLCDEAAEVLIERGYSKPRQVSTVEELDALPVGSVILRNGRAFTRFAPRSGPFGEYHMWQCPDGGFVRSTKDGGTILPATLLHEPGQP